MPPARSSLLQVLLLVPLFGATATVTPAQDDSARELRKLVQKLVGTDPKESQFAEFLLVKEGGRAVPLLLPLLADPDRSRRLRVVQMIGRIGDEAAEAKKALDGMLSTRDLPLQKATAISLLRIDPLHDPAMDLLARRQDVLSKLSFCSCLAFSGEKGLPHLMRMVRDRNGAVCSRAKDCLRRVVQSGDLDRRHLMDILALGKDGPCKEVAIALVDLGKGAGPVLLKMLDSKDRAVREAGLAGLAVMKKPPTPSAERARSLLRRSRKETKDVIGYLGNLSPEPPWLIEELVKLVDTHTDGIQLAARTEIKNHSAAAVRWARKQVRGGEWQHRRDAAKVLAYVTVNAPGDLAITLLVKLMQDPEADVRAKAAISLARHTRQALVAYQELRVALRDRDPKVRAAAAVAIGAVNRVHQDPDRRLPTKELLALLDDKDASVRSAATMALSSQLLPRRSPIIGVWIRLLHDPSGQVRAAAFAALRHRLLQERLTPDQTRHAFVAALTMPDEIYKRTARAGLRGRDLMVQLLDHKNPQVRREVVWAFGEMGKSAKKHLPKVRKMLQDPDKLVRAAAQFAVRRIDPPKPKPDQSHKGPGTRRLKDVIR